MNKKENDKKENLKDLIIKKIKTGDLKMKSKVYFMTKGLLFSLLILITALLAFYFASFVVFALRANGIFVAPLFGIKGIGIFISSLPWLLLSIVFLAIISLEILVRYFSFGYRQPIFYSLLFIVGIVLAGTFFVDKTHLHRNVFNHTRVKGIPFISPIYERYSKNLSKSMHRGVITFKENEKSFTIEKITGEEIKVILDENTNTPREKEWKKGEEIIVIGNLKNGIVRAFAIRPTQARIFKMMDEKRPPMMH